MDKALGGTGKKNQSKGFGGQNITTKSYPASYGGASYPGTSSYGNTGGYDYGGYGSGSGFGGSGYGGSGYGGGGYGTGYGTGYGGYGGTGYGTGYGGGNPYSGYDATGYGGTGYGATGADIGGTGFVNDEDDSEEEEGFELDMDLIKKRKEEQKKQKEEEKRKAEEEAKKPKPAVKSTILGGNKKDKLKTKVSFDISGDGMADSDNENNKNISRITEGDDSNESEGAIRKTTNTKKDEYSTSNNKKILDISDTSNRSSENNIGKYKESEEYVDSQKEYTNKQVQEKKEEKNEIESSYTDDFEASSKFGSTDLGKAALKTAKSLEDNKPKEFEESSNYYGESRDDRKDEQLTSQDDTYRNDRGTENKKEEVVNKQTENQNYGYNNNTAINSTLRQNYETGIAKEYVYESLLKDEKRKVDRLEAQLSLGGEQLRSVQQLIQQKDVTIHKLEAQNQTLQKDLDVVRDEAQDYEKKNKIYEVENEGLQKRIEVLETKVLELESQKRILERETEDKTKALKERKDYLEKNFESKLVNELKAQHETEKDLLTMKIEELQDENKRFQEELEKFKEDSRLYKTNFRQKAESDQEVKRLKQEIMLLELKLKDRDQVKTKKKSEAIEPEKENVQITSGIPDLDKEIQMQELLIKGFQKENEKLMSENKTMKREIEELNSRLYDEGKKVTEFKAKLVHNTDSVLITEKEIDIETKKMLGSQNLISKDDLKIAQNRIIQLQKDMQAREETFSQREMELKYELDRLREQKKALEAKAGGIDLMNLKQQDEDYRKLEVTLEAEKQKSEAEIKDLRSKLNWYIQNQDSIATKEQIIKEKDEMIKKLEEEVGRILSDPNSNLDTKSKHYNKVINEDKKRIKQLERDVEALEESLKKRNPGVYDKLKGEKDESTLVKELKQTVKKLQDEKTSQEKEYEVKLNDLRQRFDKMRLGYEAKANGGGESGAERVQNSTNTQENVEVLKLRIKELEKEVEDAKKYYLKKAQQLKDNKKGTKVPEKDLRSTKDNKAFKKALPNAKDEKESQVSDDKENIQDVSNSIMDYEKFNLINKLMTIHLTPVASLLGAFQTYKINIMEAFRRNNSSLASSSRNEFTKAINENLPEFSQKGQILDKVKRIDELVTTENNDPTHALDSVQKLLYEIVWSEMKKENSNIVRSSSKTATTRVNNYFEGDREDETFKRKIIVLEDTLTKKEEEFSNTQQNMKNLAFENERLKREKSNLELIIQRLPKNPRSLDFATMEKKLEIMERNYRESELELKNAFRKTYNMDPFGGSSESELGKVKAAYEKDIMQLKTALERKNQELLAFKHQSEIILRELDKLRKSKA